MKVRTDKKIPALYEPIHVKCASDQEKEYRGVNNKVINSNGLLLAKITNPMARHLNKKNP